MTTKAAALAAAAAITVALLTPTSGTTPAVAASARLTRYPYLTDVVDAGRTASATLNFATDRTVTTAYATIGTAGGSCATGRATASRTAITVNGVAEYQWRATFSGLTPGTRYCYRVRSGPGDDLLAADASPVFSTPPPAGSAAGFRFAVLGDWGATNASGTNSYQAGVLARIASSGAQFVLGTGDTAYPSGTQTNYGDLRQRGPNISAVFAPSFYKNVGDGIPMFNAVGNHGMTAPFLSVWPQPTAVGLSGGRERMETLSGARVASVWYAFDVGRARIYILQAAWPNSQVGSGTVYSKDHAAHWRTTSAEYRWLASDLAAHPGGLKFVVAHFPMYADSPTEGTDRYLHGPGSLGALLSRYGVQFVFNGHMHAYQRNRAHPGESFVSYVTGGGGETVESVGRCSAYDAYAVGWSPTRQRGSRCGAARVPTSASHVYHFLLVTVGPSSVTVTPVDSTGRTFDAQTYRLGGTTTGVTGAAGVSLSRPRAERAPIRAKGGIRSPRATCANRHLRPRVRWTVRNVRTGRRRTFRWAGTKRGAFPRVRVGTYASTAAARCGARRTVRHDTVVVLRKTHATTMSRREFRHIRRGMTVVRVRGIVGYAGRSSSIHGAVQRIRYDIMPFDRWTTVTYRHGRVVTKHWDVRRR
jgi:hypothetical protein